MIKNSKELVVDGEILLRKFDDPETLLQENPLFGSIYLSICHGESPYKLIEKLVVTVTEYQKQLLDISSNKSPSIKVELTKNNIELLFKEAFFAELDYPDWG